MFKGKELGNDELSFVFRALFPSITPSLFLNTHGLIFGASWSGSEFEKIGP